LVAIEGREKKRRRKHFSHVRLEIRREEEKKREELFCFPLFGL